MGTLLLTHHKSCINLPYVQSQAL